jgi:cation/acetate symporter
MPHRHGTSLANPLLGIYSGIFAAVLAACTLVLAILEQLGFGDRALKLAMAVIAIGLPVAIGAGAYTRRARDFLFAQRRVPALHNGLNITVVALGGSGIAGFAGSLFLAGFDMLFLGLGILAGLTVMVMLVAPYVRKFGAPTLPGYLGQRFDSGPVRLLAATVAVVPLMLLLVAEIKTAMLAAHWLLPLGPKPIAALIVLVLTATLLPGGVRSLSWSTSAQALTLLAAVLVPAALAAVAETNLPFGQFSHGPILRAIGRLEAVQAVPVPVASLLHFDLPDAGLQPITGRFGAVFGSIGSLAFALATLSVMAGIAGSPVLLVRAVTSPTVFDTRKAIAWGVVLVGLLMMTFSAVAVFERDILLNLIVGQTAASMPAFARRLVELGFATIDATQGKLTALSVAFERDGALVALPVLMGMPAAMVNLVAAGLLGAALAGAAASLTQLGLIVAEDVIIGPAPWTASDKLRLAAARAAIAAIAVLGAGVASLAGGDPLLLLLHALSISGSALFPVLVLSVWWKRINSTGALTGLATGFVGALLVILFAEVGATGIPAVIAPVIIAPLTVGVAMLTSNLTPAPGRHILESVRDLRIPGGETIHDREQRQARQRGHRAGTV